MDVKKCLELQPSASTNVLQRFLKVMRDGIPFIQLQNSKYDVSWEPWYPKDKEAYLRRGNRTMMT